MNSKESANQCACEIMRQWESFKFIRVSIAKDTRTLKQNAYIYKMYSNMSRDDANESYGHTSKDWCRYLKYHYGLQIRAAKEPEFVELLKPMLQAHSYENRLKAMDYIDITSTFDVDQLSQYINNIQVDLPLFEYPAKNWKG